MKLSARHLFGLVTGGYAGALGRFSPGGHSPLPLIVNCLLTFECDMACSFCVSRVGKGKKPRSELTAAQWQAIFRQVPRVSLLGFSGGEIFCHPEVRPILGHASRRHRIALVTNGLTLDEPTVTWLVGLGADRLMRRGLVNLGISLNEPVEGESSLRGILASKLELFERVHRERTAQGKRFPKLELKVPIQDGVAGYLDVLADAARRPSVDAVTFQMLTGTEFVYFLGIDPKRAEAELGSDYEMRSTPSAPFSDVDALRDSLLRLSRLPASVRARVNFLPEIDSAEFPGYYEGRMNPRRYRCTNPWMHCVIDPYGVTWQCLNTAGIDLLEVSLKQAWNDPRMRAFRVKVDREGPFPACAGCCFLLPI